ncbi:MAG: cardiolipin synthase [Candidatus Omnitrophica bacterium]|nr:cardiolipin synthase [Candidatus Omnitrophota bacterium]
MHFDFNFMSLVLFLFQLYIIITIFYLLLDNREPTETFAWIFIFILMPGLGVLIYYIVGHAGRKRYDFDKKLPQSIAKNLVSLFKPLNDLQEEIIGSVRNRQQSYKDDLMTLLYRNSKSIITLNNEVRFFHDGRSKFDALMADIESARQFIHLEYFIWYSDKDPLARKIKELLIKKAREGVEIRILYDYSGCLFTMTKAYRAQLRKAGIKVYPFFNYLAPFKWHTINYRNHRKIAVIDGKIGYTGGMNVGQEYIDGGKRFKSWRDTHLRLTGGAVYSLQAIFAIDWYNTANDEVCFDTKYYPDIEIEAEQKGFLPVQVPTSGYDTLWPGLLHMYFTMITMAQTSITIVSPYFVPEASLLTALKTAAMRGLKVTVMMTGVPDNPLPYCAAFSYFDELLRAGVRIFQYQKGFMHAKIISIDGKICSVGTTNFDIRSLKLNYEVNAIFYNDTTTQSIDAQILRDLESCREVTLADLKDISLPAKMRNSLARLFANIL